MTYLECWTNIFVKDIEALCKNNSYRSGIPKNTNLYTSYEAVLQTIAFNSIVHVFDKFFHNDLRENFFKMKITDCKFSASSNFSFLRKLMLLMLKIGCLLEWIPFECSDTSVQG